MGGGGTASVGPSTREESVKQRRGGEVRGVEGWGEAEETYLAFLNNTNAWLPGGTLNLAFSHLACSALEVTSVSRTGKKGKGPISLGG